MKVMIKLPSDTSICVTPDILAQLVSCKCYTHNKTKDVYEEFEDNIQVHIVNDDQTEDLLKYDKLMML